MPRNYTLHSTHDSAPRIDYKAELNEQQYAAVTSPPGQALVIAGAGSGKTRTLTYRVAWLLDNGIPPESILLLTFTNKAAREMLERVQALVTTDTTRLWGGTFHSIGNRLLRYNAERLGYRKGFSIMDREDQKDLMETVIGASGIDVTSYKFPKAEVLGDIYSLADNTLTKLEEIITSRYPYFEQVAEGILKLRKLYQDKKRETNCMDFDDLLSLTVQLWRKTKTCWSATAASSSSSWSMSIRTPTASSAASSSCSPARRAISWSWAMTRSPSTPGAGPMSRTSSTSEHWPRARTHKIEINYRSVPEVLESRQCRHRHESRPDAEDPAPARESAKRHAARARRARFLLRAGRLHRPAHPGAAGRAGPRPQRHRHPLPRPLPQHGGADGAHPARHSVSNHQRTALLRAGACQRRRRLHEVRREPPGRGQLHAHGPPHPRHRQCQRRQTLDRLAQNRRRQVRGHARQLLRDPASAQSAEEGQGNLGSVRLRAR
jgi:hypothetical protein